VCPICLSPFDDAVTLTSCLHTFCHGCIVAWLGHTRAAAAAAAAVDELVAAARLECPLCKAACRHFLSVEPSSDSSSSGSSSGRSPFRLYGVIQDCDSSSSSSSSDTEAEQSHRRAKRRRGGSSARESSGDRSDLPSMEQLRAAVCTQRAVALAASAQRTLQQQQADSSASTTALAAAAELQQQQEPTVSLKQTAVSAVKPKAVREAPLWQAGTLSAKEALAEIQALLQREQAALAALQQQQLQYSSR
jgi:hypothetical protein